MTYGGATTSGYGTDLGTTFSTPTFSVGSNRVDTPNNQTSARAGSDPLSSAQRSARIGDTVPIVFGWRVGDVGGVLISPAATEARFSNDSTNAVTARYLLVLSEGELDGIQVRDVFQQSCRVGVFTQAYDRRAGDWAAGNFITAQVGFENDIPDCPIYCGTGGSYAGMTTASFTNTIPAGFTQWDRQVHAFVRGGIHVPRLIEGTEGPSNNVADLVLYLMRRSSRVPEPLIDQASLLEAATFVNANGLACNIELDQPSSLADWMGANLPYFLLRESRRDGLKGLRPLLPFNNDGTIYTGATSWVATYTEDHILPGAFEITYTPRADRLPFCAQMIWRQQPEDGLGLARTADVRYSGSALDGPFEQHDLSEFATSENHAFKAGAYIIAKRRHVDHQLMIELRPGINVASIAAGDIVRVRLRRVPSTGGATIHDYLYEVDRVGKSADGLASLELTHYPVDSQGRSLVALDVLQAQGNGLMLPTGRAEVSCDLNDLDDTDVPADPGPDPDFEPPLPDPGLYDPGTFDPEADPVVDDGDGWGPGPEEDISDDFTDEGFGVDPEPADPGWIDTGEDTEEDYLGTVSFSTPLVVYPDVFYLEKDPGFARVWVTASVDNPPLRSPLSLTLETGGRVLTVVIPRGGTSTEFSFLMGGDLQPAPATCTARTIAITAASGGSYETLTTTATAAYSICPYIGTVTMGQGLWRRVSGAWTWEGGSSTDWSWDGVNDEWDWIGSGDPTGLPPSPIPTSEPSPGTGETTADYQTVTVFCEVDHMPVNNSMNDLRLDLTDGTSYLGTVSIPAVSRMFGAWEWNPATKWWAYPSPPSGWRWHSEDEEWEYRGSLRATWEWDTANERWNNIGGNVPGTDGEWEWIPASQDWVWQDNGNPSPDVPEPAGPPAGPPEQGGSTFPPDGAEWEWNFSTLIWEGTAYALGGGDADHQTWRSDAITLHYYDAE